jgi:hypothetical protein
MSSTFRELLSQTTDQVERPRALADGHYIGRIKSHEFGISRQKQTPFVRFVLSPEEATADVDAEANAGITLNTRELRRDFYLLPASLYRLSDFLDAVLGKESGRTFDERIPETRDVRVMFKVTSRDSEDGTDKYNDVGTVVAA